MGDFQRNWKGKIMKRKETLALTNFKDLKGRPVNARGYLINEGAGYVMNRDNLNQMFSKD